MCNQDSNLITFQRDQVCRTKQRGRKSALLLSAGLMALILGFAPKAGAINLLINPGFEAGFDPWVVNSSVTWNYYVEYQNTPHSGNLLFKAFGGWTTTDNYCSLHQDNYSSPGNTYSAGGWIYSSSGDALAGNNSAYYEVWFRDAGGGTLAIYRSDSFLSSTPQDQWFYYDVTNQVDIATGAITNTVNNLVAPAGTAFVRFRVVFHQNSGAGGSAYFDDTVLNQISGNEPPVISNLSPNGRKLFNPAANGLTFSAVSATTNIPVSGIKVAVNGLDVSSSLDIGGSANNRTVAYTKLIPNRLYSATIQVTDEAGYSVSSAVGFDTFSSDNFVWEAEDYDFGGGNYINNPVPTSTNYANSYFGQVGVADIDFHESSTWGGNSAQAYRASDVPGPGTEWCGDLARQKYLDAIAAGDANVKDYDVGWTYGNGSSWSGDWANYTRNFTAGNYNIYGRLSGGGGASKVAIWKVTSGAGTTTQTVSPLGEFHWNSRAWQSYDWIPLTDASGNLVSVNLSGVTTLRIAGDNANHNFYMLAPARDDLPLISDIYPTGTHPFEPTNTLSFSVSSKVATIPPANIKVMLNGRDVSALMVVGDNSTNRTVSLPVLALNARYSATIAVTDSAGTFLSRSVTFDTFSESNYSFEAEDYDFGGGQFIDNPALTTTPGANTYYYQATAAMDGVDLLPNNLSGQEYAYRPLDNAGTQATSDYLRKKYVDAQATDPAVKDYNIGWDVGGTWYNYTRTFPAGTYWIYGRLAGSGALNANMDQVISGRGTSNQVTSAMGTFSAVNPADAWQSWVWVPLLTTNGSMATFTPAGVATLRFTTSGNVNHNFLMLVPAKNPVQLSASLTGGKVTLSIPTQNGAAYNIFYKNAITDANWNFLTVVQGDGTTKTVTDVTATGVSRFYRALIE